MYIFSQALICDPYIGSLKSALTIFVPWKSATSTNGGSWEGELVVKHLSGHRDTTGLRVYLGATKDVLRKVVIACFQSKHLVGAFRLPDIEEWFFSWKY